MRFHVPPVNQGQIVEVSYASDDGYVFRCRYDQSDRTKVYAMSRCLTGDEGDYWNGPPSNRRWRKISEDEIEARTEGGAR